MSVKVTANGAPKSGTHVLQRALALVGVDAGLAHEPYRDGLPGKYVVIFRHPRNVLISWVRFNGLPPTTAPLLSAMDTYDGGVFADRYRQYLPWRTSRNALCVSFEDLLATDSVMRGLAAHLGVPYFDDGFECLYGSSRTWSGRLSNWEEVWNDALQEKWVATGGQALQVELGYG